MHKRQKKKLVAVTVVAVICTLVVFFVIWTPSNVAYGDKKLDGNGEVPNGKENGDVIKKNDNIGNGNDETNDNGKKGVAETEIRLFFKDDLYSVAVEAGNAFSEDKDKTKGAGVAPTPSYPPYDYERWEKGPLTRQELGHRVWTYLHTLASNYPIEESETEEDKLQIIHDFLQLFGKLYPCSNCGRHFREMIGQSPPPLKGTRTDFEMWLCNRHNEVNRRLGKPQFECTIDNIRDRYEQTDGCPLE